MSRWQQGECGTYACALIEMNPELRLGCLFDGDGVCFHFFAHDERYAYDSAGKHSLPYRGLEDQAAEAALNGEPSDWGLPADEHGPEGPTAALADAHAHAGNLFPELERKRDEVRKLEDKAARITADNPTGAERDTNFTADDRKGFPPDEPSGDHQV